MKATNPQKTLTVTAAVRALRQSLGESQQQLAFRMKTAIRTIARYETTRPPKGKVLAHFKQIAAENGREDLAEVFAQALAEELKLPSFSGFNLDVTAKNQREEFYGSVMLAMLRNPEYQRLMQKFNKLAAEPIRKTIEIIRREEESRSKWQQFIENAKKAGIWRESK